MFCRHTFDQQGLEIHSAEGIESLHEHVIGPGAANIARDTVDTITIKCQGCGAEVVIHTEEQLQARCHWCRQTLSVTTQIPNGSVPDMIVPFSLPKDDAINSIKNFVDKRKFWLNPRFLKEFVPENVFGVYMPYLVVDANCSVRYFGHGEIEIDEYTEKNGDDEETYYDAEYYSIDHEYDMYVNDLTVESNAEFDTFGVGEGKQQRSFLGVGKDSVNVINAILPYDTENATKYNANYLRGFASEKRDQDISQINDLVEWQLLSIGRAHSSDNIDRFDRGVRWEAEGMMLNGSRWLATYLPVWLYSYVVPEGKEAGFKHYIAVNGRTGKTMGSTPPNSKRIHLAAFFSALAAMVLFAIAWFIVGLKGSSNVKDVLGIGTFVSPFIAYALVWWSLLKYVRNFDKSHHFEEETTVEYSELQVDEHYITTRYRLKNSEMAGANDEETRTRVERLPASLVKGPLGGLEGR